MVSTRSILACAFLLVCSAPVLAHYNLVYPLPYNRIDCNQPDCLGPCPPIWKAGNAKARNSPENPAAVWRRGQIVNIKWHRNNHDGGIYRRQLVPVKHMNDRAWHKKMAFEWGCWSQGRYICGRNDLCGTDSKGFAYQNTMEVPKVFPDGDYVFAMTWAGGPDWKTKMGFFSDYYTCAFVRIQGGDLVAEYTPKFVPGKNHRSNAPEGKCETSSMFIRECGGRPCKHKRAKYTIPGVFLNGRTPPKVKLSDIRADVKPTAETPMTFSDPKEEPKAIESGKEEAKRDAAMFAQEQKEKNPTPEPQPLTPKKAPGTSECRYPTGSWNMVNSPIWRAKQRQWWAAENCCRRKKLPCCRKRTC